MNFRNAMKILAVAVILISAIAIVAIGRSSTGSAVAASDKIEAMLLDKFTVEGQADFIVRFTEQADLSLATSMGWKERGEFVYNSLKATAEASQVNAKGILDARALKSQTFIIGNELYVWAGNLDTANELAALPEVDYIRATRIYHIDPVQKQAPLAGMTWAGDLLTRNAEYSVSPDALAWGIVDTQADLFWSSFGVQGGGVKVANIDTGVQWNHPALDQSFACPGDPGNADCWSDPSNICGGTACDNNGHGTHTMGSMVADDDPSLTWQAGMAPEATWIACKGCESTSCSDFALNACADWILAPGGDPANRPHVVNNSWGGGGGDPWYQSKVIAWVAAGTFPAFSAGNAGSSCSTLGSPGDYQESFGSAAHDINRNIASFSSRGPSAYGHDPYTKPNISAPGVSVCSSVPGSGWDCTYSGTSMASPHTAGAVALLWSCNAGLIGQIDLTFQALQNSADVPPAGNCGAPPDGQGNYTFGYGYLNALQMGLINCGDLELGYVDGFVTDSASGDPIQGASVSAAPGALEFSIDAITDPNGYYTMTLVPGIYDVTASKNGYTSQTVTGVVVVTDTVTSVDFELSFLGSWTPASPTPFDWYRFDCVWYDDGSGPSDYNQKVYCTGGRDGGTTEVPDVWKYDPLTDSWSDTGHNVWEDVSNYTANLLWDENGLGIYIVGGTDRDNAGVMVDYVQRYYPATGVAERVSTDDWPGVLGGQPTTPGACVSVLGDTYLYCVGGWQNTVAPYNVNEFYWYDPMAPAGSRWSANANADLPVDRTYIQAAVQGNFVYAMGGDTYDGADLAPHVENYVLDATNPDAGWTQLADMPVPSGEGRGFGFTADTLQVGIGKLYVVGGGDWSSNTAEAMEYDIATDTWNQAFPDLIEPRRNQGGVYIPLCSEDPTDGLPGMWVFGGWLNGDAPPFAGPEFYPMECQLPQAEIELVKTVGTDPTACAATDSVQVPAGTEVTYCFTVENTGDYTFTVHDLFDDQLGDLLVNFPYDLLPGASVYITSSAVITESIVNSATWTAWYGEGLFEVASDTAEVDVLTPAIALSKTVGTDPTVCATSDSVTVVPGTDVTYCYEVTNTGDVTLTVHNLDDSALGAILTDLPYDLVPGASVFVTQTATITEHVMNTALWTATGNWAGFDYEAEAEDMAHVLVINPAIELVKTVGTDPATCSTEDSLDVYTSTLVTYCYEVTNTGDVTLTLHDLVDSELGDLLTGLAYDLAPGASVYITETAYIVTTTVNTATWTAWVDEGGYAATAEASATVNVGPEPEPPDFWVWLSIMLREFMTGGR